MSNAINFSGLNKIHADIVERAYQAAKREIVTARNSNRHLLQSDPAYRKSDNLLGEALRKSREAFEAALAAGKP